MSGRFGSPDYPSEIAQLLTRLDKITSRLDTLEAPDGNQLYQTVKKLSELVDDIQAQLNDYIANGTYNKAQLDAKFADIVATTVTAGTITSTGSISSVGAITTTDAVSATGALSGADLYATNAPSFNITGGRVAGWIESATGRLGTASSSRRYKQDERAADIDIEAMLAIEPKTFRYIDEVRKRDDPSFVGYVGPDYVVAQEVGFIAEDLADAGLTPWVVYREIDGVTVPDGVNYAMIAVAQQAVIRSLDARLRAHGL